MSDSKKEILATIRKALSGVPDSESPDDLDVNRNYHRKGKLSHNEIVDLFAERIGG
jgi:hypothetical protein